MFLHENFCKNNFKKCSCGEVIEISNEGEHILNHKNISNSAKTTNVVTNTTSNNSNSTNLKVPINKNLNGNFYYFMCF